MGSSWWTDRARLRRQYGNPRNLATRVGVYDFLVPDQDIAPRSFEEWVLDHVPWTGAEAVLDVGCGAGAYEPALRRRSARSVGVDLSPGMLERPGGAPHSHLVVGDAQRLPVRTGTFDVCLSAHMLYHVPDIPRALDDIRRTLRPGGIALLVANGAADKQEIRDLWAEAALAVAGPGFAQPGRRRRFAVDADIDMAARFFPDLRVDMLTGTFRFPSPNPVMAWVESLRAGTEDDIAADVWQAVAADLRSRIAQRISAHGHFAAHKASGVIVARVPLRGD